MAGTMKIAEAIIVPTLIMTASSSVSWRRRSLTPWGSAWRITNAGRPPTASQPGTASPGGLRRAISRRHGHRPNLPRPLERLGERVARGQPGIEVPAVDHGQPESTGRHGVALGEPIGMEGYLHARNPWLPSQGIHHAVVDAIPVAVLAEQHHAVAGPARCTGELPPTGAIQLDHARHPTRTMQAPLLLGKSQITLDDGAADTLEIHHTGVAGQMAGQPAATI